MNLSRVFVVSTALLVSSALADDVRPPFQAPEVRPPSQMSQAMTAEMPIGVLQMALNVLRMEGGATAIRIADAIDECLRAQGPMQARIAGQAPACPIVTDAIASRRAELEAARTKTKE